jgi:hypothetical protein
VEDRYLFILTTIANYKYYLYAHTSSERQSWIDTISSQKVLAMMTCAENYELRSSEYYSSLEEVEQNLIKMKLTKEIIHSELLMSQEDNLSLREQLHVMTRRYEEADRDRLSLLHTQSIEQQHSFPSTSSTLSSSTHTSSHTHSSPSHITTLIPSSVIRVWVGSWNMGAAQPIFHPPHSPSLSLEPFVQIGYELYCLGVQECVSESFFEEMDAFLAPSGVRRLRLLNPSLTSPPELYPLSDMTSSSLTDLTSSSASSSTSLPLTDVATSATAVSLSNDPSKLCGRGDGSFLHMKYTGIAIYLHHSLLPHTHLLAITRRPFTSLHSKGAVAVALSIHSKIFLFLSCHLDASKHELRRHQYRDLLLSLGTQLGEESFPLVSQCHHVIWCGDLNYRLTDPFTQQPLSSERVLTALERGEQRLLYQQFDQLNQEKRHHEVFYGYREPELTWDFYPTYKKYERRVVGEEEEEDRQESEEEDEQEEERTERRRRVEEEGEESRMRGGTVISSTLTSKSLTEHQHQWQQCGVSNEWVRLTYRVKYKEPFYKGGMIKERTPGYCDRILYWSLPDLVEELVPEKVPCRRVKQRGSRKKTLRGKATGTKTERREGEEEVTLSATVTGRGRVKGSRKESEDGQLEDNYRSVNQGEPWNMSDHSPVYGTFLLRLKKEEAFEHDQETKADSRKAPGGSEKESDILSPLASPSSPLSLSASFLPIGRYRITLSDMKLIWGTIEERTMKVEVLYPLPYEAICGLDSPASLFSLLSCTSSFTPSSPSPSSSPLGCWMKLSSKTNTCYHLRYLPAPSSPHSPSSSSSTFDSSSPHRSVPLTATVPAPAVVPPLVLYSNFLTHLPLESLHLAIKVTVPSHSINTDQSGGGGGGGGSDGGEVQIGHCSIDFFRVCKTAHNRYTEQQQHPTVVDTATQRAGAVTMRRKIEKTSVSIARQLLKEGAPLYSIDRTTMEVSIGCTCSSSHLSLPILSHRKSW